MRNISIEHTDYDKVIDESWYVLKFGYLITPNIAMEIYKNNIWLYSFEEPIGENEKVVSADKGKLIALEIHNSNIEVTDLETIAKLSFIDLAKLLASNSIT